MKLYGPTMQCNSKTLDYVKYSKCQPLVITHTRTTINDRLSINQMLPQLINISHRLLTDPLL